MTPIGKHLLRWTPRVLCIAFAIFISIFALDVFGERLPFWRMLLALAMHLVPTAIVVVLLLLSWRWPWIGGLAYLGLGCFYLWLTRGRFPLSVYIAIAGPCFLVGTLFLANWVWRAELKASSS